MTTHIDSPHGTQTPTVTDDERLELPFTWEDGAGPPETAQRDTAFRFPAADDPRPRSRRLLGMSLYTAVLGTVSLAVALRAMLSMATGGTPAWYGPVLAVTTLVSVALAVGAFLSIHRRRLPWALLLGSTVPFAATVVITIGAG